MEEEDMHSKEFQGKKEILAVPYIVKKVEEGYVVECIDLNIVTQGNTLKSARKNIGEAILLHFQSAVELGMIDNMLEKLGVIKKKNELVIPDRKLEHLQIEIPSEL
ncbi:MAG: type II toxin-antitoxin system HicB family antitoxin [Nanoarchaeota archaeon]